MREHSKDDCARGEHLFLDPHRIGGKLFEKCYTCGQVDPMMMDCYLCSEFKSPARQVVRTFVSPGPDPTEVYVLECGHHII